MKSGCLPNCGVSNRHSAGASQHCAGRLLHRATPLPVAQQPLLPSSFSCTAQPQSLSRRQACSCSAVAEASAPAAQSQAKPSSAETARTVVSIVSHGTLSTLGEDGSPLGTYASYVLDERGLPILRLRAEAVHTGNLLRDARCSLFVQPEDMPARLLGRSTLIGRVRTGCACLTAAGLTASSGTHSLSPPRTLQAPSGFPLSQITLHLLPGGSCAETRQSDSQVKVNRQHILAVG